MSESQQEKVLQIVKRVSTNAPADISPDESLFDSGTLDSFALPDLVSSLEQTFGITIPDADLNADTFESVKKIVAYIDARCRS